jgi:hypothetical protein
VQYDYCEAQHAERHFRRQAALLFEIVLFAPKLLLALLTGEAIQIEPKRMRAADKPRCQEQRSDTS